MIPRLRITEVPLVGGLDTDAAQRLTAFRRGLLPALTLQAATQRRFSCCWTRTVANGPVEVRVGIEPDAAGTVSYPVGARGVAAAPVDFPFWLEVEGTHDVLSALPEVDVEPAGTLEDLVEALPTEPFAWLVLAEPVGPQERIDLLDDLHLRMTIELDREKISGRDALELERSRGRYRDFAAGQGGLWHVRIVVGAAAQNTAELVAQTLAGASDLHSTPYALTATGRPATQSGGRWFEATGELLAAVARPPVREIAGLRVVEQVRFDLTPETSPDGIPLGDVIDAAGRAVGAMTVSQDTLNRHAFVAGATGSGKSQTIRHLLEGLTTARVPWLVIEPAKAEYSAMAGRLGADSAVAVIRLGDPDAVPLSLNPLEPEDGFPLQTHLDLVRALFLAAFEANEPFPQVLSQALTRCYTSYGWDLALSRPRRSRQYPTLADLQTTARAVVDDIGYGAELAADVRGFVDVRLTSLLLGTPGRFLGGGHPLDVGDLLSRNVVLELEDVGDDQDKAFCMGVVLIRLFEHLRVRQAAAPGSGLRHVTVVEEAHRLLKATIEGTAGHAVEMFAGLLAEIRAYGEGIVVAEQIPAKIIPDVVKNSALKILHRLPAADDREVVGATMNLDDPQSRAVVSFPPGHVAVFSDGMDRPIHLQIPYGESRERRLADPPTVAARGRRTAACGAICQVKPCTLRDTATAGYAVLENPTLTIWVELLTVAHLAGLASPAPVVDVVARTLSPRELECAVAETVTRAVGGRADAITADLDPQRFAKHLAETVTGVLVEHESVCGHREIEWQAGLYRFADVADDLRDYVGPRNVQHPATPGWRERGLELAGTSIDDQIKSFMDTWSGQPAESLLFGDGSLTRATARLSSSVERHTRIIEAAKFLHVPGDWHHHIFRPSDVVTSQHG
jgi:hypothetical protein